MKYQTKEKRKETKKNKQIKTFKDIEALGNTGNKIDLIKIIYILLHQRTSENIVFFQVHLKPLPKLTMAQS